MALIAQLHEVYPDFRITNEASATGPNGGIVQWTATGTDSGFEGATGESMNVTGISRYQFVDGKIAGEPVVFDRGTLKSQLDREDVPHRQRQRSWIRGRCAALADKCLVDP